VRLCTPDQRAEHAVGTRRVPDQCIGDVDAWAVGVIYARHETEAFNVWDAGRSEATIPATCPCRSCVAAREKGDRAL
jgi:hypothetical protein